MLNPFKRILLIIAGILSLVLGVIGAFVPLLPTVPLVLLAAFCFARSSDHLHQWLVRHRYFGPIIESFQAGKGIPRKVKYRAIFVLWLSMGFSAWVVGRLPLQIMLFIIGLSVTIYLLRLPEYRSQSKEEGRGVGQ
ncbi:MAG: YbaN family protein [Pseudomonadales bacterium]